MVHIIGKMVQSRERNIASPTPRCSRYCKGNLRVALDDRHQLYSYCSIGLVGRVFANHPGDQGSVSSRLIPKTQKIVLGITLLNTQHRKVRIKSKVEQSRERNSALPDTLV